MPHLHAMLMPATADGRRKAHEVFNPASLHQLQTDYSLAIQAVSFAVQRGIKGVLRSSMKPAEPITAPPGERGATGQPQPWTGSHCGRYEPVRAAEPPSRAAGLRAKGPRLKR
jgi:hypothetical protein